MRMRVLRILACNYPLNVHHTSRKQNNKMDYAVKFLAFIFAYKSYLSFKMYSFLGIFHNRLRKDKPEVVL
jgi:hypothetical protein